LNESEARLLTGSHNLMDAANQLLTMGPQFILIKKGEHGSMLFGEHGIYIQPAFPIADVVDPTGAGDTFAGALMGYLTQVDSCGEADIRRAMLHGSVVASYGVQAFSLDGLRTITEAKISSRVSALRSMMQVT